MIATLHTLFDYQAWANENLCTALQAQADRLTPEAFTSARRLLNHVWLVEQIFRANLQGEAHGYTALNTPDTPTLETLRAAQGDSARWFAAYLATLTPAMLAEALDFVFVDGKPGRMRRAEMLLHLITHGSNHRGMVGRILAAAGGVAPKDTLTVFLHRVREQQSAACAAPDKELR